MLSLTDCIAFSGLSCGQLDAIARHEHLPLIIAAEWAETTLEREGGCRVVDGILSEDFRSASVRHPERRAVCRRELAEFRAVHAY